MLVLLLAALLTGTPMGSTPSVDYNGQDYPATTTVNTPPFAFDGDLSTFYASYERNNTFVGLDLGSPHIITRVGWSPRNDGKGPERMILGVIEGANNEDFNDALPLYLITQAGVIGEMTYADIHCSKGFRYVRYVGPHDARCNIAELAFYGEPGVGDDSQLYRPTNLPSVVIHTLSGKDPEDKVNNLDCVAQIISDDELLYDTATTRLRGNFSATFEKKPYRIKFESKHNVLSSPAKAKKWTLINNYGDKTLMRNLVAFETSRLFDMPYTPFATPVDVFMNGEYKGCYQLCDQVEVGKGRVHITEMEPTDISGDNLTGGYFWEIDAYANEEVSWFKSKHNNPVTIKSPDEDEIVKEQRNYLVNYFNQMENAVYGTQFADPDKGWRSILDPNTFLKHFLVGEFSGNTDTYWSVYQYKHRGDKTIYTGPVWDFDIAFNNDNRTYPIQEKTNYIYLSGSHAGDMKNFVNQIILNDPNTAAELHDIWAQARQNGLDETAMLDFVDSLANMMDASQKLNFMRWPILNKYVHMNPQVAGSYAGEVAVLKQYIQDRIQWLDTKLNYTPTSINPVQNTTPKASCTKFLINGHLVIQQNGRLYTLLAVPMEN